MLAKTIKYTDFLDQPQEETFYFHLTKAELTELAIDEEGVLGKIQALGENNLKGAEVIKFFKQFIIQAVGERSEDGKRFIKDEQFQKEFGQTAAFDTLLSDLVQGDANPVEFMKAILPADIAKQAEEHMNQQKGKPQDFKKKA